MSAKATDKVIVITGASRGIGLEWTKQASLDPNTFVVAVVRNLSTANLLEPLVAGGHVAVVEADMMRPETFAQASENISAVTGGRVDVLINNAGGWFGAGATSSKDMSKSTPDEWSDAYKLNTVGPVFFTKALLPLLEKSAVKQVVNISSFLGNTGFHEATDGGFGYISYSVAKGALNFATLKYHLQLKDQGYTFITLNPGYVATDLTHTQEQKAPLTVEASVSRCKSFVDRLTVVESGGNYSLDGSKEPLVY
ncbi:hypothetical protein EHS25_001316 [Saitozyma podzolica]|uniref:NAD(P)-binding protein n=1 Tax=Saitozyma podzolica TaxID=1890683 RepID=A0A427YG11_9TREE|nr:hypothetical protein EHS25_001316 [Saitozyma podzolica]